MVRPKIGNNFFQERDGINRVAFLLNQSRVIWRETQRADVGVDGQAELVDEGGEATGTTIAVQVKSGPSHFTDGGAFWKFYPEEKHRTYWEHYPLPVIIMLHDPASDVVFWEDARRVLRSDQRRERFIAVPKVHVVSPAQRLPMFAGCGAPGGKLADPLDVLRILATTKCPNASFPISYLDIFLEGLTDIGRKIFFSMGMCCDLAEGRIEYGMPIGLGAPEFDFVDGYVRLLVSQALALVDYSDFLIDLLDREMVSTFIVPLTSRGRAVRDLCLARGTVHSQCEITECSVAFIKEGSYFARQRSNFAVADRLRDELGSGMPE